MRHDGTLLGKALDMLCLAAEVALRDKEWKVSVAVSRLLKSTIEVLLHLLPDAVAVGLDDHTAAHGGVLSQSGLYDDILVPL